MATYDQGDLVQVTATFKNASTGAVLDPTAVYLKVCAPDHTETIYQYGVGATISRVSTGVYRANIDASQYGKYQYRWYSTGNGQASEPQSFYVKEVPC